MFGLTRGVGAETLSAFFGPLPLEAHVGCAPSALRRMMHTLAPIILETTVVWEQQGRVHGERRPRIGAVDATCLQRLMLVCMGYPFNAGHCVTSMTYREGLRALPRPGQVIDVR